VFRRFGGTSTAKKRKDDHQLVPEADIWVILIPLNVDISAVYLFPTKKQLLKHTKRFSEIVLQNYLTEGGSASSFSLCLQRQYPEDSRKEYPKDRRREYPEDRRKEYPEDRRKSILRIVEESILRIVEDSVLRVV
jgi:hypothetical protein